MDRFDQMGTERIIGMKQTVSPSSVTTKLCFRLLPVQILLAVIGTVNGIVNSLFASNYIGQDAMSAVGLFAPISMFIGAVSTMLLGGSQILSAEYKGKNQVTRTQEIFSLDMMLSFAFSVLAAVFLAAAGAFDLTGRFTYEPGVRVFFNQYLLGMSLSVLPQVLGQQLSGFLSLENQTRRTLTASIVYILVNPVFNYIFIKRLRMQALGLALASVFRHETGDGPFVSAPMSFHIFCFSSFPGTVLSFLSPCSAYVPEYDMIHLVPGRFCFKYLWQKLFSGKVMAATDRPCPACTGK